MTLVRWRPRRDLLNFPDEMNRFFSRFFDTDLEDREMAATSVWYPSVDISENEDEFIVSAELPGLKRDDIHITFRNGALFLEGERKIEKEEKDSNYHRVERRTGKFCRSFQMPGDVKQDKISASYKDGLLEIHLPKTEETKPKEIEVKVS